MATLNADEVNALMDAIKDGRVSDPGGGAAPAKAVVTPYDLTSRDRIIRGQMPTLDAINEQIASLLGTGLAGRTRLNVKVTSSPATLLKLVDFNSLLAPPTIVGVMSLGPSSGLALAAMEPGLGDVLLAAALGDRQARADTFATDLRRDLTSVERLVLKRLLTILTDAMQRAWEPVLPLKPEVMRFESDPRLAIIGPPNEAAILTAFELSGAISGRIQLAIPFAAVEPVKKLLSSAPRVSSGGDLRFTKRLAEELLQVPAQVSVVLGRVTVALRDVIALDPGHVLTLNTDEGAPLAICIEGREKACGQPRVLGGSHAVVLEGHLTDTPRTASTDPVPHAA